MKCKRFVLWSGGADSTYLIYKSLQDGYEVTAGYAEIMNNTDKTKMELAAIELMLPFFNAFPDFRYVGPAAKTSLEHHPSSGVVFWQLPTWLFTLQFMRGDYDELAIGYVMNDDAISYLNEIEAWYKAGRPFSKCEEERDAKLVFPLSKFKKDEGLRGLPENIKSLTVWCESPEFDEGTQKWLACRRCHTCTAQKDYRPDETFVKSKALKDYKLGDPVLEEPVIDVSEKVDEREDKQLDLRKMRAKLILTEKEAFKFNPHVEEVPPVQPYVEEEDFIETLHTAKLKSKFTHEESADLVDILGTPEEKEWIVNKNVIETARDIVEYELITRTTPTSPQLVEIYERIDKALKNMKFPKVPTFARTNFFKGSPEDGELPKMTLVAKGGKISVVETDKLHEAFDAKDDIKFIEPVLAEEFKLKGDYKLDDAVNLAIDGENIEEIVTQVPLLEVQCH